MKKNKRKSYIKSIIGGLSAVMLSVSAVGFTFAAPAAVSAFDLNTDSDYDGIDDIYDKRPQSNSFKGTLITGHATSNVEFNMDYRWFFGSNGEYIPALSTVSSVYATAVYADGMVSIDGDVYKSATGAAQYFGMEDVEDIKLSDIYNDNHVSEVVLGHRKVEYNGQKRDILLVAVRGTNSSIQEWSSNFDVGDIATFDSTPDWHTSKIHKGFDITARRIMKLTDDYINRRGLNRNDVTYWVTGHSRGGAVANVIGAYYEHEGRKAFTYTFAAPNTTLDYTAGTYRSIFNIVNKDDFITYLPVANWGYYKYGRTANVGIAGNYAGEFRGLTGVIYNAQGEMGRNATVNAISGIITGDPRVELYSYTGHDKSISKTFWSDTTRANYLKKLPTCAKAYSQDTLSGSSRYFWGSRFSSVQAPAFFLQLTASVMANQTSQTDYVAIDVAPRYEKAKYALIATALSGVEKPHYPESYYLLSKKVTAASFK